MPHTNLSEPTPAQHRPPVPRFELSTRWLGPRAVLRVAGEIDLATTPRLNAAATAALDDGAAELWIDLCDVEFMDSTGLNTLLALHRRTNELHRSLGVICPDGTVRRLFALTGVDGMLALYASRTEAERSA